MPDAEKLNSTVEGLTNLNAWKALKTHYEQVEALHLREIFANDPGRGERLTLDTLGLFFDYLQE